MFSESLFGEPIFSYSRKQAIADGVLVDLSNASPIKTTFQHPFACTSAVWSVFESALNPPCVDVEDICEAIIASVTPVIRAARNIDEIRFRAVISGNTHSFKLHLGPGDTPAPVFTLMLPEES